MAAKGYSAGAIFLQVVPVFANVQRAIEDEAKNIDRALGDQMEKSGEKAGGRAGRAASRKITEEVEKGSKEASTIFERDFRKAVKEIEKSLDDVDVKRLPNELRGELRQVRKEVEELSKVNIFDDRSLERQRAKIEEMQGGIRRLRDGAKIAIKDNFDFVGGRLNKIVQRIDDLRDPIELDVRPAKAERQLTSFEKSFRKVVERASGHLSGSMNKEVQKVKARLDELGDLRIGVDISAGNAQRELAALEAELRAISSQDPEIDVKVDSGRAFAELAAFSAALERIDGQDVRVDVDTRGAQTSLFGLRRSGDDAANSFRSFNIVLLAVAGAGPALIPVLGAIAGGLLAIGPAAAVAGAGLGSVLVGFSGIGDALTALGNQQDQAAMIAQTTGRQQVSAARSIASAQNAVADAERSAARSAEAAARRVADARRSAADAVEAALKRQKQAQESYRDSVEQVREAEKALREARKEAATTGDEIKQAMKANQLAIDQAMLDEFNTTVTFNATMDDGSATNAEKEQARINMERARLQMEQLREKQKELAKEKRRWDKQGVDGTKEVQTAQDRLNDALKAQKDAYEDVRDAAKAVDEARADGARRVADAIRAQNETLADNARSIQRAREGLAQAKQASDDMANSLNSQQNAVNNAMDALSPAGRKFALFLFGMRADFEKFRDDIQEAMLPSIQQAIEGFIGSSNAGTARAALVALAAGFGDFVKALSVSFQGEAWGAFFEMLADLGPSIQEAWGDAFIYFLEAMASILTVLAPYALRFAEGLRNLMERFADWAASAKGAEGLQRFMDHMAEIAPDVLNFIGVFALALTNILVALAPYSEMILGIITGMLDWIAKMDTEILGNILVGILAILTASQVAYAVMNLLMAGTALLTSAVGMFVFMALGLGLAIYYVYTQNEKLGIALGVLLGVVVAGVAAFKAYRAIVAMVALAKFGYATATTGATVATTGFTIAQRIAYGVGRAYAAITSATTLAMVRQRIASAAITAALIAQNAWTKAVAAAQWLFNAAMSANPIALIVIAIVALVAAIAILWKEHEGFRRFVIKAWDKIQDAFKDAWRVIDDVLDDMGKLFQWLWKNAVKPALDGIWRAFKAIFPGIKALWTNILWPVLKLWGKVVWTLWKTQIKVALTLILAFFKVVFKAIQALWRNVLKPVFDALGKAVKWLWEKAVKPAVDKIGDGWGKMAKGMKWTWDRVLKPVFDFMVDKALPKLKSAFKKTVEAIEKIWGGLKKVVGTPIKFVINTVIRDGLIGGFNKVAKWVGLDGFDFKGVDWKFATGGIMPGYTPGRDVHNFVSPTGGRLALSGGEAIMRPEWTAAMGPDYVNQMNALARQGGVNAIRRAMMGGQAYAKGGIFFPLPGARTGTYPGHDGVDLNVGSGWDDYGMPYYSATPGRVTSTGYGRGYGNAVFVASPYGELVYGHSSSVAVRAGQQVRAGQMLGRVGNTGNSSAPHLHFGFPGGSYAAAMALLSGALVGQPGKALGGGDRRSIPSWLMDIVKNPLKAVKGWASGAMKKAGEVLDSPFGNTLKSIPGKLVKATTDKVWDVVPGWVKTAAGWAGDAADWIAGGAKKAGSLIKDGVKGAGNLVDKGLGAIGLADGGILPYNGTMMYDNGGYLPPGLTTVVNLTGKPEPVFTNDQWRNMENGTGSGTIHYEPHFEGSDLRPEDVAADLNFQFRKMRRGGKYEEVGQ